MHYQQFRRKSNNYHWLRWMFALCLPVMVFFVLFGKGGIAHCYAMHVRLKSINEQVFTIENVNIRQQVMLSKIRQNPEIARQMASKKALVAPAGSVIYRFPKKGESAKRKSIKDLGFFEFLSQRVAIVWNSSF